MLKNILLLKAKHNRVPRDELHYNVERNRLHKISWGYCETGCRQNDKRKGRKGGSGVGWGMGNVCDIQLVATDCRCGVQVDSM